MKFSVSLERRFWQYETHTITVEAKNATEARKIAKEKMHDADIQNADWDPGDSGYDNYGIDEVEAG